MSSLSTKTPATINTTTMPSVVSTLSAAEQNNPTWINRSPQLRSDTDSRQSVDDDVAEREFASAALCMTCQWTG